MSFSRSFKLALAGLVMASGAALAQAAAPAEGAAPPAAPRQPGAPEVKMVGDWAVRCFPIQGPAPCDMYQEMQDQRSRQRVLSFSIAYVPSLNRNGIQITVPLEVSIPKGLVIQTDSFKSPALKYRQCDRNGCYVQMPMDNASIAALSKSGSKAKVTIVADGTGKSLDLAFSLNGFAAAHDQMSEQNKAKGKAAPAPAAAPAP